MAAGAKLGAAAAAAAAADRLHSSTTTPSSCRKTENVSVNLDYVHFIWVDSLLLNFSASDHLTLMVQSEAYVSVLLSFFVFFFPKVQQG